MNRIDKSDEAQRAIERNRWRLKGTVNRRVEIAFGPDEISQKMPSSTIANTTFSRNAKRKVRFGTDAERNRNSTRRNVRRKTRKDASAS